MTGDKYSHPYEEDPREEDLVDCTECGRTVHIENTTDWIGDGPVCGACLSKLEGDCLYMEDYR